MHLSRQPRQASRSANTFQIKRRGVAGRVGLMIVQECAGLVLLKAENPIGNFQSQIGEAWIGFDPHLPSDPPVREQPPEAQNQPTAR
jgi:hypothetical protein